jgi:hypothetical protein
MVKVAVFESSPDAAAWTRFDPTCRAFRSAASARRSPPGSVRT